jgi:hypothetical protein
VPGKSKCQLPDGCRALRWRKTFRQICAAPAQRCQYLGILAMAKIQAPFAPAEESSSRHAKSELAQLARLLGRAAAKQAIRTGDGMEISDADPTKTKGTAR